MSPHRQHPVVTSDSPSNKKTFLKNIVLNPSGQMWYPLVNYQSCRKSPSLIGKSTIKVPFSIAI